MYFDVVNINNYNIITGQKYCYTYPPVTSPFVSVYEMDSSNLELYMFKGHSKVGKTINGIKINDLEVLQIIHGNNLLNKTRGNENNIKFEKFGIFI